MVIHLSETYYFCSRILTHDLVWGRGTLCWHPVLSTNTPTCTRARAHTHTQRHTHVHTCTHTCTPQPLPLSRTAGFSCFPH